MGQQGKPPGSNNKPKLYEYCLVHSNAPKSFEGMLDVMAKQGWRVIGQSFSSVQFFSCLMERQREEAPERADPVRGA